MAGAVPADDVAEAGAATALCHALSRAVVRVAADWPALHLRAGAATGRRLARDAALADLDAHSLCMPLAPPDGAAPPAGAEGAIMVVPPALTDACIEVQTIGVLDGPVRPSRRPTRIDASLVRPFAGALLQALQAHPPAAGAAPPLGALRPNGYLSGTSGLDLAFDAPRALRIDLPLTLAEDGGRAAQVVFLLPEAEGGAPAGTSPLAAGDPDGGARIARDAAPADPKAALRRAPVRLDAMLPPVTMPLSRLLGLTVGDVIEIGPVGTIAVALRPGTTGRPAGPGRRAGPRPALTGRLGQLGGMRAVKLDDPSARAPAGTFLPSPDDGADRAAAVIGSAAIAAAPDKPAPPTPAPPVPTGPAGDAATATASDPDDLPDLPDLPDP